MKKLLIMLGIVAFAACSQAASITWGSGAFTGPNGEALKGTTSSKNVWGFLFESTTAPFDVSSVYADFSSGKITSVADGKYSSASALTLTGSNSYTEGTTVYGAVLYLFFDTAGSASAENAASASYYIANVASGIAADAGSNVSNLATTGYATSWTPTAAVPEPTSGLMLVLGVAALAMKRKRV